MLQSLRRIPQLQCWLTLNNCGSTRGLSTGASPVYELRTYSLVPSKVGAFMALSKDKFHLRTEHSKLLGYWTVELGGLNQVTHLWEYDSYSHRAGVRAKLGGHQQWQEEYFQKILPWLQHQNNIALRSLLPPNTMADPGEAWELWQLDFSGGGNWEEQLVDLAHHLEQEVDGAKLGGVFSSVFGPIKTGVVLWQHKLLDDAPALQESLAKSDKGGALMKKVGRKENKILAATPFSPWQ